MEHLVMSTFTRRAFVAALASIPWLARADDVAGARAAAAAFRRAVSNQRYDEAYELLSDLYKEKTNTSKATFVRNMRNGRATVGEPKSAADLAYAVAENDPVTGYKGKMYSFDYKAVYEKGAFFERMVIINESGRYRIGGLWSNPAPL